MERAGSLSSPVTGNLFIHGSHLCSGCLGNQKLKLGTCVTIKKPRIKPSCQVLTLDVAKKIQGKHVGTMTIKQCDLVPRLSLTLDTSLVFFFFFEPFFTLQVQAAPREVVSCEFLLFSYFVIFSFVNVTI